VPARRRWIHRTAYTVDHEIDNSLYHTHQRRRSSVEFTSGWRRLFIKSSDTRRLCDVSRCLSLLLLQSVSLCYRSVNFLFLLVNAATPQQQSVRRHSWYSSETKKKQVKIRHGSHKYTTLNFAAWSACSVVIWKWSSSFTVLSVLKIATDVM